MEIQHKQTKEHGTFFIPGEEDDFLAELVYSNRQPGKIVIEHTEVNEKLQGQNIGYQLVHSAVEYAREHQLKIIPLCSFAKSVMDKKQEFEDVVEKE